MKNNKQYCALLLLDKKIATTMLLKGLLLIYNFFTCET